MAEPTREHLKLDQILRGAHAAFVELGYGGTSVDELARRAGVSKPTLYMYVGDKRAIFAAVLKREFEAQARAIFTEAPFGATAQDGLRSIAVDYVTVLLTAQAQDLFRVVVAESLRFPELGLAFYESGPGLGAARLAKYLSFWVERGELAISDLRLAAHQFTELCRADLFYKRLLCGEKASQKDIRRVADAAVQVFTAAYAPAKRKRR